MAELLPLRGILDGWSPPLAAAKPSKWGLADTAPCPPSPRDRQRPRKMCAKMHAEHGRRDLVSTVTMSINSQSPWRIYYGTVAALGCHVSRSIQAGFACRSIIDRPMTLAQDDAVPGSRGFKMGRWTCFCSVSRRKQCNG